MRSFFLCVFSLLPLFLFGVEVTQDAPEFVIVTASYNNGRNNNNICLKNLDSLFSQTYPKFSVIYVNDCSSDDTASLVAAYVRDHQLESKMIVINNTERKGGLRNLYETINSIDPNKIVVLVDGDDMLADDRVLERIAKIYSDKNIWVTCGSAKVFPHTHFLGALPPSQKIKTSGNFASYPCTCYPLKTFYAKLFQQIKKEDFLYQGQFYPAGWDLAFMRPMLEMATYIHFMPVAEVLYLYYVSPISDGMIRLPLQIKCLKDIKSKPPYKPLKSLFDNPELTN